LAGIYRIRQPSAVDWLLAGAAVLVAPVSAQIPANREFCREFCDFGLSEANFVARNRCAAATFRTNPYSKEQGIFSR
jgi:hypothetical protein